MFATPLRCYGHIKNINGVLAIGSTSLENLGRKVAFGIGRVRCASDKGSKDKDCCKEEPQTAGRRVEPWPKTEPVTKTPWRTECSREPQPPNYDPYRIKVPEVVVPPLPPSNAKEASEGDMFYQQMQQPPVPQDFMYSSPIVHPDYWRGKPIKRVSNVEKDVLPKLGYHGIKRLKYAFHEPWRPLDRLALLQQAERDDGLRPEPQQEAEGTEEGANTERAAGKERTC